MVGTIFVNFLSNSLATVTNQARLTIIPNTHTELLKVYGMEHPNNVINVGGVQYGQNRDILCQFTIPTNSGDDHFCKVRLEYGPGLYIST
jgi:hypothetical protein